jgi:hypothetical protein
LLGATSVRENRIRKGFGPLAPVLSPKYQTTQARKKLLAFQEFTG